MNLAETFVQIVNAMTPNLPGIYSDTVNTTLADWATRQKTLSTASGAAAIAIPGLHMTALAADAAFILNRMGLSAYGVGAIKAHQNAMDDYLEPEDFAAILGYWSGDAEIKSLIKGQHAADFLAGKADQLIIRQGDKLVVNGLTKALLGSGGYMAGPKLDGKVLIKPAAKFVAKFGGKLMGGFIPFAGPIIGGGVNFWLITTIIKSADEFYDDKIRLIKM